jgi:hypothetical protein
MSNNTPDLLQDTFIVNLTALSAGDANRAVALMKQLGSSRFTVHINEFLERSSIFKKPAGIKFTRKLAPLSALSYQDLQGMVKALQAATSLLTEDGERSAAPRPKNTPPPAEASETLDSPAEPSEATSEESTNVEEKTHPEASEELVEISETPTRKKRSRKVEEAEEVDSAE